MSADMHHAGYTESIWTSWTTDPKVARFWALKGSDEGIVLKATIPAGRRHIHSNDQPWVEHFWEFEILIEDPMRGSPSKVVRT